MSSLPSKSTRAFPTLLHSKKKILRDRAFLSVLLHSIIGELYKIRRRAMSKILFLIGLIAMIVTFSAIVLHIYLMKTGQIRSTSAEISAATASLRLPTSLIFTVGVMNTVGLALVIILAGTIVGEEYGAGTIRLLLTRGPTRTQYLLAKGLAVLVCIVLGTAILITMALLIGAFLYKLSTGIAIDFGSFFTGDWVFHALIYVLLIVLKLFIYAVIALSLATLGRSTAAGVAGGIAWWLLEQLLDLILAGVGSMSPGIVGDILKAIPDYFIGNNIDVLLTEQSHYLGAENNTSTILTDWRAWLVIAIYFMVFLRITWWVSQKRDITN